MKPVKRLDREALIQLVASMLVPGDTTEDEDEYRMLTFAANCPDPVAATDILLEAKGKSPQQIVDEALALPERSPSTYSFKELHAQDALRHIRFE